MAYGEKHPVVTPYSRFFYKVSIILLANTYNKLCIK